MPTDQVHFEIREGLGIITLRNPDSNRMNNAVLAGLQSAIGKVSGGGVRALLVRGDGPVFSLGADVKEMLTQPADQLGTVIQHYIDLIGMIEALPIPTIAAVHGICSSGGLELALGFDQLWAASGTKIGFLEPLIAALPLAGGVQRIAARAGHARAFEITSAGILYAAEEFERWNIVTRVLPADTLQTEAEMFATKMAAGPTHAYGAIKALLSVWDTGGVAAADKVTVQTITPVMASDRTKSTIAAYLARIG
jgi:enoyl-CoA hydratase/carnithine racemase